MTIWIMAIVLLGLLAAIGYFQGAIAAGITLLGTFLGAFLAVPLGPYLYKVMSLVGVKNTVLQAAFAPLLVVLLFFILSAVLGYLAHWQASRYYQYRVDEAKKISWEIMLHRVGACLGLATGLVWFLVLSVFIYVTGYLSVQFAQGESDPFWLRFINSARADLQTTGVDKAVAPLDPAPKAYYHAADNLGLIYHNSPALFQRVSVYPPFLFLGERPEFQEMVNDKDFMDSIKGKSSLVDLVRSPHVQNAVNNPEISQELAKLDFQDLKHYLEKGTSPKYDMYKILGRWNLDVDQVIITTKKMKPDISGRELRALREVLQTMSAGTLLKATPDNRIVLTIKGMTLDLSKITPPPVAAPPPVVNRAPPQGGYGGMSGLSAEMRRRYGNVYNSPTPASPSGDAYAEGAPPPAEPPPLKLEEKTFEGTWEGEESLYQIKLNIDGREEVIDVRIQDDYTMILPLKGQRFVFVKQ